MAQREWSHQELAGVPGSQVFDTDANWRLISECVRQVLDETAVDASAIRALSTTSMREGMVLYDRSGHELWACPNVDSRAGAEAADLVERGLAETIYRQGGDWVAITAPARPRVPLAALHVQRGERAAGCAGPAVSPGQPVAQSLGPQARGGV